MYEDWRNATPREREDIERMCGGKPIDTVDEYEMTI
jgi:hypothetical protein